jgi:hypothetical protein
MTNAHQKKPRAPVTPGPEETNEPSAPATETSAEEDPVTENRRVPARIPEEGGRGDHSVDDPITRERVVEESGQ